MNRMKVGKIALGILGLVGSVAAQASGTATIGGASGGIALTTGALLFLGAGAFAYFGTKYRDVGKVLMALGVLSVITGGSLFSFINTGGIGGTGGMTQDLISCGTAATTSMIGYDKEAATATKLSGTWYVYDAATGVELYSGVTNSTTAATACTTVNIYGDDTASIYTEPVLNYKVTSAAPTLNVNTHKVATLGSMNFSVYDSDWNVLSGDSLRTDYYINLAGGQEKTVYGKLDLNQANRALKLCGFAVGYNNIKALEINDANYELTACPKEVIDAVVTVNSTAMDFDACYKRKSERLMHGFDTETVKMVVKANTADPVFQNNSAFFINVLDCGWSLGANGQMSYGWATADDDNSCSAVGAAESLSSPAGGTEGTTVEVR